MYSYEYPHPAVTVDVAVFSQQNNQLKLLLIQRANDPHKGKWALPGGFIDIDEDLETAAKRELEEETGISVNDIEQLYTYGDPKRDPRERVITVVYTTLISSNEVQLQAASDAAAADWFDINDLPELAFDHSEIIRRACERITSRMD
jgi:ADP-ribose pyrophosphatase YjhB (NUDIX family)